MKFAVVIVFAMFVSAGASADWITEIGGGYKIPETTSVVLRPECDFVIIPPTNPVAQTAEHAGRATASCGGDSPIAIIWPIAWQSDARGPWTVRAGWFHMSSWFDGKNWASRGDRRETHFDCLCATATFNWSRRKRE